ncbi:MAG: TIGR03905 family TSCPD domain-containing protein [Angelakisella sp.]
MTFSFDPKGVCSRKIDIELDGSIIKNVKFTGGCHGNLQGISALLSGMTIDEAITKLSGINCNGKGTSCPDQLSKALAQAAAKLA